MWWTPAGLLFALAGDSDWPVCELAATYQQVIDALREILGPISDTERAAIFGGNAARVYGIS